MLAKRGQTAEIGRLEGERRRMADYELIRELRAGGESYLQICAKTGYSLGSVQNALMPK